MELDDMLKAESVFSFRDGKYRFHSCCFGPSITMVEVDTGEQFSFGFKAPIQDEFHLLPNAKVRSRKY